MTEGTTVVILAAGKGTRMRSPEPKVLTALCGRPLIAWVMDQALSLAPDPLFPEVPHELLIGEWKPLISAAWQRDPGSQVQREARGALGMVRRSCRGHQSQCSHKLFLLDAMPIALCLEKGRAREPELLERQET